MAVELHSLAVLLLGVGEKRALGLLLLGDSENCLGADPFVDVQSDGVNL